MVVRTIASLCSGGGGLDLGVHIAVPGARTVVYVEREAYAAACLVARMEEAALAPAPIWDDLTTFDGSPWRGVVDLVVAGFPCQPASVAGARRGTSDERWMWPHVERIIGEVAPEWVFLENVRGLLSVDRGAAFASVLEGLARRGFDAEWDVFRASDVGAKHRRERIFILARRRVAHARGEGWRLAPRSDEPIRQGLGEQEGTRGSERGWPAIGRFEIGREHVADARGVARDLSEGARQGVPALAIGRRGVLFPPGPADLDRWRDYLAAYPDLAPAVESPIRRGPDGLADRVGETRADELRLLGNGVVPDQAAAAFVELAARFHDGT